mmetsp:Transcript_34493/g.99323  ORF Transcript_34493/g.99323 Transcript_34493/m.99323 type:complete len:232 (+) Transcript_34493:123-818(+)
MVMSFLLLVFYLVGAFARLAIQLALMVIINWSPLGPSSWPSGWALRKGLIIASYLGLCLVVIMIAPLVFVAFALACGSFIGLGFLLFVWSWRSSANASENRAAGRQPVTQQASTRPSATRLAPVLPAPLMDDGNARTGPHDLCAICSNAFSDVSPRSQLVRTPYPCCLTNVCGDCSAKCRETSSLCPFCRTDLSPFERTACQFLEDAGRRRKRWGWFRRLSLRRSRRCGGT